MVVVVSLVVVLVGGLIYLLSVQPKRAELGRIAFAVGLFWFIAQVGPQVVAFLQRR